MANNYYDATGVLILDRVTPVITALFGSFALDESYPGNGAAYIARISESNDPQWDDVLEGLLKLANSLKLSSSDDDIDSIESYLRILAKHYKAEERQELEYLIEHHSFDDSADLDALFLIATCFDDGHGLKAIKFEGAWHCSKPRLFEFGGEGTYISDEIILHSSSSRAVNLGEQLREAIVRHSLSEAAEALVSDIGNALSGISDESTRAIIREMLAAKLMANSRPSLDESTIERR